MVTVENNKTGKQSTFTKEGWEQVKNNPQWKGVFKVVQPPKEPAEVTEAKARKANKPSAPATTAAPAAGAQDGENNTPPAE